MENEQKNAALSNAAAFFALVNNPLKLKLYLFKNLPSAFFSGLKLIQANEETCIVSVPYKRFTKNPFHSTYFACLSMAAELSTGVLSMASTYKKNTAVSMLVTGMKAKFYKKAKGLTFFTCSDGKVIQQAVLSALATNEGQEITAHTVGKNEEGELIAEFWFTWSFKAK